MPQGSFLCRCLALLDDLSQRPSELLFWTSGHPCPDWSSVASTTAGLWPRFSTPRWATSLGACSVITLATAPGSRSSGPWALSVALISASGPRHLPLSESCHPAFRLVRLPFMPTPRHCLGLSSLSSGACCSFTRPIPGPPAPWLLLTAWLLAHLPGPVFYTVLTCWASFLLLPGSPGTSTSSSS